MAAALDQELLFYKKIRQLLEETPEWADIFDEGNRIWYDDLEGAEAPEEEEEQADDDYPRIEMLLASGRSSLWNETQTFATHTANPGVHTELQTFTFRIKLTSELLGFDEVTPLGAETRRALRAGWTQLVALGAITANLEWDTRETLRDEGDQTRRFLVDIRFIVNLQNLNNALQ